MPIGSQTLLERHVANLASHGFSRVYIAVRYFKEIFAAIIPSFSERYDIDITLIDEDAPLGTFGTALELCKSQQSIDPSCPFVVINADVISDIDLGHFYDYSIALAKPMVVVVNDFEVQVPYGVVSESLGSLVGVREKPLIQVQIFSGIYFISPRIGQLIERIEGAPIGVDGVIEALISRGESIGLYRHLGRWIDTGTLDDLVRANELFYPQVPA